MLNYSLPALGKKTGQFSQVSELRSGLLSTEDKRLATPEKFNPHKRLPVISSGKKHVSIITKSVSASEFEPLGGNINRDTRDKSDVALSARDRGDTGETTDTNSLQNVTFKEYYFQTMPGFSDGRTKTNQDAFYINFAIKGSIQSSLFAVFDGHGPQGHRVSDFLKRSLTSRLE